MRDAERIQSRGRRAARHQVATLVAHARGARRWLGLCSTAAVFGILGTLALAPEPTAVTAPVAADPGAGVQTLEVTADIAAPAVSQESYTASTGPETLIASGTNEDWAKLVLIYGGWPLTSENVTVMLQWMREENGPDDWWNRNNPLNNGHGSGGGSGLGSYDSLDTAAWYAADNLRKRTFYTAIVAALEDGTSAHAVAQAIWASPWASSHYGNGAHWTTSPVQIVQAPASAW